MTKENKPKLSVDERRCVQDWLRSDRAAAAQTAQHVLLDRIRSATRLPYITLGDLRKAARETDVPLCAMNGQLPGVPVRKINNKNFDKFTYYCEIARAVRYLCEHAQIQLHASVAVGLNLLVGRVQLPAPMHDRQLEFLVQVIDHLSTLAPYRIYNAVFLDALVLAIGDRPPQLSTAVRFKYATILIDSVGQIATAYNWRLPNAASLITLRYDMAEQGEPQAGQLQQNQPGYYQAGPPPQLQLTVQQPVTQPPNAAITGWIAPPR